jgi:hypothetical protein
MEDQSPYGVSILIDLLYMHLNLQKPYDLHSIKSNN